MRNQNDETITLKMSKIQSNFSSKTDGSFTMASFLSQYEILPIAQENKY